MRIIALSDTHNQHKKITVPECDLIIHAGDATNRGEHNELAPFLNWFSQQKSKYKVYVPGNHDFYAERNPEKTRLMCEDRGITLLIDEGVALEEITLWGSPYTQYFGDWAFQAYPGEGMLKHWTLMPPKIDILVTHSPPYQILDRGMLNENIGCYYLFYKILEIKPKVHIFGHSHDSHGSHIFDGIHFYNVACGGAENPVTVISEFSNNSPEKSV